MLKDMNPGTMPVDFLGAALDSIEDPLFLIQDNAEICYVNRSACETLGYSTDELLSMRLSDIDSFFPDDSCHSYWNLLREKGQILLESTYRKKDGVSISVELKINHFVFSAVDHYLVIASCFDLNNRLDQEQKWLREHFSEVLLSSTDLLWEVDQKGRFTYVSPRVRDVLGYEPCEVIGKSPFDFMPDKESDRVSEIFESIVRNRGNITDLENWNTHKNGSAVCLITNGTPILDSKGEFLGYRGADKDITYRKRAEQAINDERSLLRGLIYSIPDPVYIKNNEGAFLYVNKAYSTFVNKPVNEIIGKQTWNICDCCSEKCFCKTSSTLNYPEMGERSTQWIQCPDREVALLEIIKTSCFSTNGNLLGVIGISHDVTEYQQREEELRLSEERLLLAQSIAQTGNWDWEIEQDKLFWSDETYRIFGHEPQSFEANYESFIVQVHPDELEYVSLTVERAIQQHIPYDIEHRILLPDGNIKVLHGQGLVFFDDAGVAKRMSGTVRDITAQHRTKQQLKKRLKYAEGLAACSKELMADEDSAINTALEHLLNASNCGRIYLFRNFNDPDHGLSASYDYEACAEGVDSYLNHPDFKVFQYVDGSIYKGLQDGRCHSFTLDELSEREQIRLHEQDIKSKLLIPVFLQKKWFGFIGFDGINNDCVWNSDEVLLLSTAADMFSSYFQRLNARNALLAGYEALELEVVESRQNIDILGKNLWKGISDQKQKEAELRESQERFNQLADNTNVGFFIFLREGGKIIYANAAMLRILECSSTEDLGDFSRHLERVVPEDRSILISIMDDASFSKPVEIEYRIQQKNGMVRWLRDRISPVFDATGNIQRVSGIMEDVTELKLLELDRLEAARKQRNTLVREVHHRIKNHLQGITGLLSNEAFRKPEIKEYLDNAIGQINAIATIHGLQGKDAMGNVNLLTVLESIIHSLEELYLCNIQISSKLPVEINCLCLEQNEAVPISLILNELLQNAIKHSVLDVKESIAQVEISKAGDVIKIRITNHANHYPSLQNLQHRTEVGTGLALVRSMMPTEGAALSIGQDEETFTSELELQAPVIDNNECSAI